MQITDRDAEPKFKPRTGYSKARIEELTGYRTVTSEDGILSAIDAAGDYSQYDFYQEAGYYYLLAVDGEKVNQ